MSHVLHLGHQTFDLMGADTLISTDAAGFDPALDTNCIKLSLSTSAVQPFSADWADPTGDVWLSFRYRAPASSAHSITSSGVLLELYDANHTQVARIRTDRDSEKYHAAVYGDSYVMGNSSFLAATALTYWFDIRIAVGAEITMDFYVDGVLQSSATTPNTGGMGKPVKCIWKNQGMHGHYTNTVWYIAHIAVLDGVSTIGRRFVRRSPDQTGAYDQFTGGVGALTDDDPLSRATSDVIGQRLSFTLAGPAGPAGQPNIAGVHVKKTAQLGAAGPTGLASFLRMGGVDYDAAPVTPEDIAPTTPYTSWARTPRGGSGADSARLPGGLRVARS